MGVLVKPSSLRQEESQDDPRVLYLHVTWLVTSADAPSPLPQWKLAVNEAPEGAQSAPASPMCCTSPTLGTLLAQVAGREIVFILLLSPPFCPSRGLSPMVVPKGTARMGLGLTPPGS